MELNEHGHIYEMILQLLYYRHNSVNCNLKAFVLVNSFPQRTRLFDASHTQHVRPSSNSSSYILQ